VKTTISADGPGPRPTVRPTNPWVVAAAVTLATFMATLDSSVANVALPFIAGSLSASMDESTSILSSFMVATAIAMPLAGWLAAVVGRKRYYMAGVLIFTVSSALCGLAPSLGWLIAFRVLQGIGGADCGLRSKASCSTPSRRRSSGWRRACIRWRSWSG
jgi:DHA2 family multidrug resistance protein